MNAARIVVALVVAATSACATSRYTPAGGPFISITMDGGRQRFHTNGRVYDSLADAMAHDAEAHRLIREGESDLLLGGLLALGGSVLTGLGSAEILFESVDDSLFGAESPLLGIILMGLGLGGSIGGIAYAASGERDRLDALAMFNDHELARWLAEREAERAGPPAAAPAR